MSNVLVMGGSGLIGKAVIKEMSKYEEFNVYSTYNSSSMSLNQDRSFKIKVEDVSEIHNVLDNIKPQIIISCLRGDFEKQLTFHIEIAEWLKRNEGRLFFFSTANVFDNDLNKPHYEDDEPCSCSEYGKYKIKCEKRMVEILKDNACILRIPQVWGKGSPRMRNILELLENNEKVVVYPKLFLNTISDKVIAEKLLYIIKNSLKGTFHITTKDIINHKDFNVKLIEALGFNSDIVEEDFEEEGCFALLSKRDGEFTEQFGIENNAIIKYLVKPN